jgi:Multimeric flavodoxin WrbA
MDVCILMGSPRKEGNTAALLGPFTQELEARGCRCETVWLYGRDLRPCVACRACQRDWTAFGCPQPDGMQEIFDRVLRCDLLVLATPIYSWYCTPPMKAVLDRLVYGMNKYYGEKRGPSLWEGKPVALVSTCGYPPEKGADLWEEGVRRYCRHSRLRYAGMLTERHMGYDTVFMDAEKEARARAFAARLAGDRAL